ncbi:unnamed protein product, partial [Staurois parvus]
CPPVCTLTLGVTIRVQLYIIAHQSAPLHQLSPSECPFTSGIPITVPPYIRYSHQSTQSTPFLHISPLECPFTAYYPSECPFPSHVPIRG